MKVLYLSTLIPDKMFNKLIDLCKDNYVVAPHKFHRSIVNGFTKNNCEVKVISYLPQQFHHVDNIVEDSIDYIFLKQKRCKIINHISIIFSIINKIKILLHSGFKPDIIICDTLNVSLCLGAILAKMIYGIKLTGIITDFLGISRYEGRNIYLKVASKISNYYITKFDYYVLLTLQMNEIVNPQNKPYIVMEGLYNKSHISQTKKKEKIKRFLYAGGRPSKDGVDILITAFKQLTDDDIQLHIYGPISNKGIGVDKQDNRIFYHGVVDNATILNEEYNSYLLINPRPTGEKYTYFSFPSKIMEFMATGVPMVTTKLAGIPQEYYKYVYFFDDCSVESYYNTLKNILMKPEIELQKKGLSAQKFIFEQKNNIIQTKRIMNLIKNNELSCQ